MHHYRDSGEEWVSGAIVRTHLLPVAVLEAISRALTDAMTNLGKHRIHRVINLNPKLRFNYRQQKASRNYFAKTGILMWRVLLHRPAMKSVPDLIPERSQLRPELACSDTVVE